MPAQATSSIFATGAYTLPDAAHLLNLPLARLRWWVRGALLTSEDAAQIRRFPVGTLESSGDGRDRHFGFLTLIELFTIAQLRNHGVRMSTLRAARTELSERYETPFPFALRGLLTDGCRLIKELGEEAFLEIGTGGQTAFESLLKPFCHRLDFDTATQLANRFFPAGRKSFIIVDPKHSFGRPVIVGTNITTESIASLIRGGEQVEHVAIDFGLQTEQVQEACSFQQRLAA